MGGLAIPTVLVRIDEYHSFLALLIAGNSQSRKTDRGIMSSQLPAGRCGIMVFLTRPFAVFAIQVLCPD